MAINPVINRPTISASFIKIVKLISIQITAVCKCFALHIHNAKYNIGRYIAFSMTRSDTAGSCMSAFILVQNRIRFLWNLISCNDLIFSIIIKISFFITCFIFIILQQFSYGAFRKENYNTITNSSKRCVDGFLTALWRIPE